MIYGLVFGCIGVVTFIYTNNNLIDKYYNNKEDLSERKRVIGSIQITDKKESRFPLSANYIGKYTKLQKQHYLITLIMFVIFNAVAFELYFNNYTKLHMNHNHLIYIPIDVSVSLFINSICYYYYHRLVHTKYLYKYIHSYHHAYLSPEPFDSLVGHPIDHTFSAILQILPMFIYKMHIVSFLTYSSILSTMGIYDHCGVKIKIFGYKSLDHHIHHKYPAKNFTTWAAIDKFHGTYKSIL
jgi:sterol desaturase/sphingolipid hydroxylase (fatty acid hydroxylase superfamily)